MKTFYINLSIFIFLLLLSSKNSAMEFDNCKLNSDCKLVKDGYCSRVLAIHKDQLKAWLENDKNLTKEAFKAQQTCTPLLRQESLEEFNSKCENNKCIFF